MMLYSTHQYQNQVSPNLHRATCHLSPVRPLPQEMNILLEALRLPKRHMPLPTLPPNTQHHSLPHPRPLLLLNLLYDRPKRMPYVPFHIRDRSSHEPLDVRKEEILCPEERCYLGYWRGAEDVWWKGFWRKVEEVGCFGHECSKVFGEGGVARGGFELFAAFDAVPVFGLASRLVDARIMKG